MRFNFLFASTPKHSHVKAAVGEHVPVFLLRMYAAVQLDDRPDSPWLFGWVYPEKLVEGNPIKWMGRSFYELFSRTKREKDKNFADPSKVLGAEQPHLARLQKLARFQTDLDGIDANALMSDEAKVLLMQPVIDAARETEDMPIGNGCLAAYDHIPLVARAYDVNKLEIVAAYTLKQAWRQFQLTKGENVFRTRIREDMDTDEIDEFEKKWLDALRADSFEHCEPLGDINDAEANLLLRGISHRQGNMTFVPSVVLASTRGVKEFQAPYNKMHQMIVSDVANTPFASINGSLTHASNIVRGKSPAADIMLVL